MKLTITFICLLFLVDLSLFGNDSDFYGGGGGVLFPVLNDQISVKKEVLKITHRGNETWISDVRKENPITVEVDYLFFNHGKSTVLNIGFEAFLGGEEHDQIPDIQQFTVLVNGKKVRAKPHLIDDTLDITKRISWKNILQIEPEQSYSNKRYVYLFKALMKKGFNRIKHRYKCFYTGMRVSYCANYSYDLFPALRWKNRKIEDFTLILDFDDFSQFTVDFMTRDDSKNWTMKGNGKLNFLNVNKTIDTNEYQDIPSTTIYIKKGIAIFKAKDFVPMNNLDIDLSNPITESHNYRRAELPLGRFYDSFFTDTYNYLDELFAEQNIMNISHREKIIRNLPFARRGYIFKNKMLLNYYINHTDWYKKDPKYKGSMGSFSSLEKDILKFNNHEY